MVSENTDNVNAHAAQAREFLGRAVVKKVDFSRNDLENPPFAAPTVQDGSRPGIAPGNTELVPTQATPQA